jgi:hypothetical protein
MDLFDTLTFAEILGRTTCLGTLSLTVLACHLGTDFSLLQILFMEV